MQTITEIPLKKIDEYRWEIPREYDPGMRVPGLIFCDEKLLETVRKDQALKHVANVAHLPGIVRYSLAMPDIHWGYGFPIGGVAATDPDQGGVISPGGIGFDINCGVRLVRTHLTDQEVQPKLKKLVANLFHEIPCGVGQSGDIRISASERPKIVTQGARWVVKKGYGVEEDLTHTEAGGSLEGADPEVVSERAYQRGKDQLGTLGSGNHFLEVQVIDQIFDSEAAARFGLHEGEVSLMIHSGSRGFGYQICDDSLGEMRGSLAKYHIQVPDIQLACAPVHSSEGKRYLGAMRAFPPGHEELPDSYRDLGQPVVIPGDMGRNSYLLLGTQKALDETFGTTCHGAGRVMSRAQAVRSSRG